MSTTFADLVDRVEITNSNLMLVRDAIIEESIDSTSSIIDAVREGSMGGSLSSSGSNISFDEEQRRESEFLQVQQNSFLESILFNVQGIYNLMLEKTQEKDQGMPDWAKFAMAETLGDALTNGRGPIIGGAGGDGNQKGKGKFSLKSFFGGVLRRGGTLGILALIGNEILSFFFDKTIADLPGILAQQTRDGIQAFKNIDWKKEWDAFSFAKTINDVVEGAIKIMFGEGTLESAFTQAGIAGSIGFMVAGPLGAIVLGALGFVAGMIKEEDVITIKDKIITWVGEFFDWLFSFSDSWLNVVDSSRNANYAPLEVTPDGDTSNVLGTDTFDTRAPGTLPDFENIYGKAQLPPSALAATSTAPATSKFSYEAAKKDLEVIQKKLQIMIGKRDFLVGRQNNAQMWYDSEKQRADISGVETTPQLQAALYALRMAEAERLDLEEGIRTLRPKESNVLNNVNDYRVTTLNQPIIAAVPPSSANLVPQRSQ